MSAIRIIKKYPNRRLYDTILSRYITLDEVKSLVLNRTAFQVIDTRTNDDVTNHILLQIISEHENSGTPIFTNEVLQNIIRFYGNSMQKIVSQYIDKSIGLFTEQQSEIQSQLEKLMQTTNPLKLATGLAQYNLSLWRSAFEKYLAPLDKTSRKD